MLHKVVEKYSDGCALNNNVTITTTGNVPHQQEQTYNSIVPIAEILLVTVYNCCGKKSSCLLTKLSHVITLVAHDMPATYSTYLAIDSAM